MAALAALRATEKNIEALEDAFHILQEQILEGKDHTKADIKFHNIIAKSTQNPIIRRIVPIINDSIVEGYQETKDIPESGEKVLGHHRKVLDAILAKDEELARQYMKEHIQSGMKQILQK
jgi:DNA-binding FadR family transcriptional regulator